jgi:hypothetical protein
MAITDLIERLRDLDAVLLSRDPTVIDAFKQAIVLTKVAEDSMNINPVGPLEQMWRGLQDMRREMEQLKNDISFYNMNRDRGAYWSPKTYEQGRNYGNWGVYTTTTADDRMSGYSAVAKLTDEQLAELTNDLYKNTTTVTTGTVMPASPTDLDAFTMFDSDTGDSMSVKYK